MIYFSMLVGSLIYNLGGSAVILSNSLFDNVFAYGFW